MRSIQTTWALGILIGLFASAALTAQVPPPSQTGTITGVVRTTTGLPVPGLRVTAMPAGASDDGANVTSSLAVTDDTGRYRLENLPTGRYFIAAGRADMPTFYPATLDRTKATAVSVSSPTPNVDINITVQDVSSGGAGPALRFRAGRAVEPVNPFNGPKTSPRPAPVNPFSSQTPRLQTLDRLNAMRDRVAVAGAWWTNKALVTRLGITEEQKKKIESIFEQHRSTLVQNKADLEKEEATLARMLEAEPMESTKLISAQIDRVVQTRGDMERTNSTMTLEMRQVLTRAQWVQLQAELPQPATGVVTVQPAPTRRLRPASPELPRLAPTVPQPR